MKGESLHRVVRPSDSHLASHILRKATRNNDHIVSNVSHELDAQVDHPTKCSLQKHAHHGLLYRVSKTSPIYI